jgi:hypothetical protein
MLLLPFQLQAETPVVEKPHTFSAGTPARASEVNANFDVAYEYIHKLLNVVCKYHPSEPLCQTTDPEETYTNDFGMTFVLIQPGTFVKRPYQKRILCAFVYCYKIIKSNRIDNIICFLFF